MEEQWKCFFEDENGNVLSSEDSWEEAEEAAMWGQRILERPDLFQLLDADEEVVEAELADPDREFTVELIS